MSVRWNRREFVQHSAAGLAGGWALRSALAAQALPKLEPGRASILPDGMSLENAHITARWWLRGPQAPRVAFGAPRHQPFLTKGQLFQLTIGGQIVSPDQLASEPPHIVALQPDPGAARLAERLAGLAVACHFADSQGRFRLEWRAELRDGSHYIRQILNLQAGDDDLPLTEITLLDLPGMYSKVIGTVPGSPLTVSSPRGGWFFGLEHPQAHNRVENGRALASFVRALPVAAGHSASYSAVVGVVAPGQMRRDFLAYIERERAHPYRPFLHYNSWFDLGYFTPYDQAGCLDVIHTFGEELVRRRHVPMNSFLFDDGWDNHDDWSFNAGFPDGFTPLKAATAAIGAAPGVWLSPWGGYGKPRQERLANASKHGYETNREGLALSGPVYYKRFHEVCLEMIQKYGINQFKLDGTGSNAQVVPGSAFGSDFEAAISLIGDMRRAEPDLFINLTTGTYPSPFWLFYADSTWRGGSDTSFAGVGSDRQQWITYRDADTFRHVVERGPLYPLNALMLHGIVYAKHARRLDTDPGHDFDAEVRAYFGTGTDLQEMYISHDLLTKDDWDVLAEAAQWARRRADVLVDTHWLGGDPRALTPYSHAAWSPSGAVLTLRNPSDQPQKVAVDVADAFELPAGAPTTYTMRSPWKRDQWRQKQERPRVVLRAGEPYAFSLKPFEVLTLDSRA